MIDATLEPVEALKQRIAELEAENALLKGAIKAQDERNLAATERVGLPPFGCDTPEQLADEIEALRAQRDTFAKEALNYQQKVDRHAADMAHKREEVAGLRAKLELPRKALRESVLQIEYLEDKATYQTLSGEATKARIKYTLAQLVAPDTDHCPSCGEYLHDEMGHMCPDTGVQQDPYVRLRAALVENDHLKRQLAEARAEINRLREKLGWVPAVFDTEALREAGK